MSRPTRRRAATVLEVMISIALFALVLAGAAGGFRMMAKQSASAGDSLEQTRRAMAFLDEVRLELGSMVMNPFGDPRGHDCNSFVISRPFGTSIQFVTAREVAGERKRFLVYYEAANPEGRARGTGLVLRKKVWEFTQDGTWMDRIEDGETWPAGWIGELVEERELDLGGRALQDLRWQYLVPEEDEGRVFFRIRMVLATSTGRRLPFSTLVSVATPQLPADRSACPCLFATCYDPGEGNLDCCLGGVS